MVKNMTFIQLEDDRINLENITGYGIEGSKKIRIYFATGKTTSYSYDNSDDRDSKLKEIDKLTGLTPPDRFETI